MSVPCRWATGDQADLRRRRQLARLDTRQQELLYEDHNVNGRVRSVQADRISAPELASPLGHYHPFGWGPDGGILAASVATAANVTALRTDGSGAISDIDVVTFAPNDGSVARALVKTMSFEGGAGIALSPDGRWLAYTSNVTGSNEIWVQPYEGSGAPVRVSSGGGVAPRWAPRGDELYYVEGDRMMAVPVKPSSTFEFEPATLLFESRYGRGATASYDVSADGRFLMVKPSAPGLGTTPLRVVLNWTALLR